MKIRFIRKDIPVAPGVAFDAEKMVERGGHYFCRDDVDHETTPKTAWRHIHNMDAIPVDAEAKALCQPLTQREDQERLKKARDAVGLGIAPDDLEMFYNNEILGYRPDGSYIPGPNWQGDDDDDDDADA